MLVSYHKRKTQSTTQVELIAQKGVYMTTQQTNQVINYNTDYAKKVQAGILLPKKQHENFEMIKAEIAQIKELVLKVIESK